jgi:hypothetical protein
MPADVLPDSQGSSLAVYLPPPRTWFVTSTPLRRDTASVQYLITRLFRGRKIRCDFQIDALALNESPYPDSIGSDQHRERRD